MSTTKFISGLDIIPQINEGGGWQTDLSGVVVAEQHQERLKADIEEAVALKESETIISSGQIATIYRLEKVIERLEEIKKDLANGKYS